ncbi:MAG: hypothetical protein ACFBWO_04630 [Paracoccaceae bacterium]
MRGAGLVLALCLLLQGCIVGTVVETAVDVTATAVTTTADVAATAVTLPFRAAGAVIGSGDDDDDDEDEDEDDDDDDDGGDEG